MPGAVRWRPRIVGYNLAVAGESGQSRQLMRHRNADSGSVAVSTRVLDGHPDWTALPELVTTVSFEEILATVEALTGRAEIAYLKLDCENSEYDLLLGKDLSRIDWIGMELHWQMGEARNAELLAHLSVTHDVVSTTSSVYVPDGNRELLLKRRSNKGDEAMPQFRAHLLAMLGAIERGRHFALTRYADGERGVLEASGIHSGGTNRHWCYRPELGIGTPVLSEDLNAALDHDDPDYYVGISCPCCAPGDYAYYRARLSPERLRHRTTYSNIVANDNWRWFNALMLATLSRTGRTVVLISNWDKPYDRAVQLLPFNHVVPAPASRAEYDRPIDTPLGTLRGGAPLWYCHNRATALARFRGLARSFEDAIFLFQLGPVARVLVHQMFLANRRNTYLDLGHGLDGILFLDPSPRGYLAGEPSKVCDDMEVGWDL